MKKYKNISFIIVGLITSLFLMTSVNSIAPGDSNIGGGAPAKFPVCNGSDWCYNTDVVRSVNNGSTRLQAIRVSIVDANGNRVGTTKSIDYARNIDADKAIFETVTGKADVYNYVSGGKRTKNELINSYRNSDIPMTNTDNGGTYVLVPLSEHPFPKYLGVAGNPLKNYFLDLGKKDNNKKEFFQKTYLDQLGYDLKVYDTPEKRKGHLLLIEPVIFVRITSNRSAYIKKAMNYLGTVTEVAMMMSRSDAKDSNYTGKDRFFDLFVNGYRGYEFGHGANNAPFDTLFPLSIHVTGTGYTGGLQGIQSWIDAGKSSYAAEIKTGNGVAAGHVMLSEIIPDNNVCSPLSSVTYDKLPQCCDALIKGNMINVNHLPKCCDSLPKSSSLYQKHCVLPPPPPNECNWRINIDCTDNCDKKSSGSVKDMEDWKCIFESRKSRYSEVQKHFYEYGGTGVGVTQSNPYCEIYCREDVNYEFPRNNFIVMAGHHFTVNDESSQYNWAPVSFSSQTECRTTSDINMIKHEQFAKDWDAADKRVISTWNEYKRQEVLEESRNRAEVEPLTCDYQCDNWDGGVECCMGWESKTCERKIRDKDGNITGTYDYDCSSCTGGWEKKTPRANMHYPVPTTLGDYGDFTAGSWCSSSGRPASGVRDAKDAYNSALTARNRLLPLIKTCNDWRKDLSDFSPDVYMQYEEARYGGTKYKLEKDITFYEYTEFYKGSSYRQNRYISESDVDKSTCNGFNKCYPVNQRYPSNDNMRQFGFYDIQYRLPANVYRYISNPAGVSANYRPPGEYVDVGYSNLPVHYSRKPGQYGIKLEYTTFGKNHKFTNYIFKGMPFGASRPETCSTVYECKYRVINDFKEECTVNCIELNAVFRPISLTNPFPAKSGNGRTPGSNWRWDVQKITNNRGLSNPERIYFDRQPLYTITLNTSSIRSIRDYNRRSSGYTDFNMKCKTGQGTECRSQFIKEFSRIITGCGTNNNWDECSKSIYNK